MQSVHYMDIARLIYSSPDNARNHPKSGLFKWFSTAQHLQKEIIDYMDSILSSALVSALLSSESRTKNLWTKQVFDEKCLRILPFMRTRGPEPSDQEELKRLGSGRFGSSAFPAAQKQMLAWIALVKLTSIDSVGKSRDDWKSSRVLPVLYLLFDELQVPIIGIDSTNLDYRDMPEADSILQGMNLDTFISAVTWLPSPQKISKWDTGVPLVRS